VGTILGAFTEHGFGAAGYDIIHHSEFESITTASGFMTGLQLLRRLKDNEGLAHWATVCSSWVWMSRGSTQRSVSNILGSEACQSVAEGNMQVARMVLLLMLVAAKRAYWILEQPNTSLMPSHPDMKFLAGLTTFLHTFTWMGMFGAGTKKPTKLLSNSEMVMSLRRRLDNERSADWDSSGTVLKRPSGVQGLKGLKDRPGIRKPCKESDSGGSGIKDLIC
jgi:hypothetical protein